MFCPSVMKIADCQLTMPFKALQNTHRGRRTLDDGRHHRAGEYTQNRVAPQHHEGGGKYFRIPVGLDGRGHEAQPDEQKRKADENLARVLFLMIFHKQHHDRTDAEEKGREKLGLQRLAPLAHGHDPAGHGGTNIGSHDDAHGLGQVDDAGVDKADHHDRGGGGALDDGRHRSSHQNPQQAVVGEHAQEPLHPVARRALKTVSHLPHSIKKHSQSADELKQHTYI